MRLRGLVAAGAVGLLATTVLPSLKADEWDKKTIITVNEPLAVPGKVLQPGKYVMKLMESPADRHIVQIFNEDQSQLQTTVIAIPNYRMEPTDKTQFTFWEMPAGQPHALRAWFYPGDNYGQEFAYPKDMAGAIAKNNNQNVPTVAETDNNNTQISQTQPGEAQQQTAAARAETPAQPVPQPAPAETAQAQPAPAPEPAPAPAAQPAPAQTDNAQMAQANPQPAPQPAANLPRTASSMPLFGLAGLLAVGLALSVRILARQLS